MTQYNPKSLNAEEFINDAEILDTLRYADENKNNVELIDALLEKARPKKQGNGCTCEGLTYREASVLLACDIPEKIERMYEIAEEIKKMGVGIMDIEITRSKEAEGVMMNAIFALQLERRTKRQQLLLEIQEIKGVISIEEL